MHYHHWMHGAQDEGVYRELKQRFTEYAINGGWTTDLDTTRLTSPGLIGLPYDTFPAIRFQTRLGYYAPVGETIEKLARSMSRTLVTIQIPDGTWIAHRPQIVDAVNGIHEELGLPAPTAFPSYVSQHGLQLAMNWMKMPVHRARRVRPMAAVVLGSSGYSNSPGLIVSARTARKVVLE